MTNKWRDRVIRGGFIVVAGLGLAGGMIGMVGIVMGQPSALRGGASILVVAALIGAACLLAVNFPSRHPKRQ